MKEITTFCGQSRISLFCVTVTHAKQHGHGHVMVPCFARIATCNPSNTSNNSFCTIFARKTIALFAFLLLNLGANLLLLNLGA